jgi:hypothetical protein
MNSKPIALNARGTAQPPHESPRNRSSANGRVFREFDGDVSVLFVFLGALTEADSWAAAIFVDEFDAGGFECAPNHVQCRATWLADPRLKLMDGYDPNPRLAG